MTAVSAVAPGVANDEALYALLGSRNPGFYDAESRRILVSLTDGRAKTKNLRRDQRSRARWPADDV